jgi:hypothetical protein
LKGYKNEFYRYDVGGDSWQTLTPAPAGGNVKWDKGSWLAYDGVNKKIYAHKAKYHEFYSYNTETDSWSGALTAMPIAGSAGSKKSKDGGCGAYQSTKVYALKGGGTFEFWRYHIVGDSWGELASMPAGASGKKVKAGADIVSTGTALYATKGNKQNELWTYVPGAFLFGLPERSGVMAGVSGVRGSAFAIAPNPLASGYGVLRYSLPKARAANLSVFNVAGQRVMTQALLGRSGIVNLDLRHVSNGVYLAKLVCDDFACTQKLLVQR